ncbi:GntR family transcriptional regulator [Vibrio cincinnatiensis]|nr:winged helix-turn-helix domain-containing protein [Vibrio cincinnatiensis]
MLYQFIHIDPQDSRTLQDQIKSDIAKAIFAGFVPKQTSIMSSRRLAEKLKVSRNTILRVYEQLAEEGVLVPIERKGYYVNPQLELGSPAANPDRSFLASGSGLDWFNYLNAEHSCTDIVGFVA